MGTRKQVHESSKLCRGRVQHHGVVSRFVQSLCPEPCGPRAASGLAVVQTQAQAGPVRHVLVGHRSRRDQIRALQPDTDQANSGPASGLLHGRVPGPELRPAPSSRPRRDGKAAYVPDRARLRPGPRQAPRPTDLERVPSKSEVADKVCDLKKSIKNKYPSYEYDEVECGHKPPPSRGWFW